MKKLFLVLLIITICGSFAARGTSRVAQRVPSNPNPLILEGQVKTLEKSRDDSRSISFKVTLLLTFKNVGAEPIVMYRHNLWLGGVRLSRTIEDAGTYNFIYRSSAWPANWGRKSGNKLRTTLNQPTPPPDRFLVLQPGQSWQQETDTMLELGKKEGPETQGLTWDEIRSSSPVWLFVTFEMWPVNAEPNLDRDNPRFGLMLRKRWKSFGELWLHNLTSQPIVLDFNSMKDAQ